MRSFLEHRTSDLEIGSLIGAERRLRGATMVMPFVLLRSTDFFVVVYALHIQTRSSKRLVTSSEAA